MRLFAAVNLPPAEKTRLGAVVEELRRSLLPFRFADPESLHITLKFFGEVRDERCAVISTALRKAAQDAECFEVGISGFGTFPRRGPARVLWIGVYDAQPLERLQERLEQLLEAVGFAREPRPFHPHITIGRATSQTRGIDRRAVDRITGDVVYNAVVPVRSIDLMRSHLSSRGAQYERVEQLTLGGKAREGLS